MSAFVVGGRAVHACLYVIYVVHVCLCVCVCVSLCVCVLCVYVVCGICVIWGVGVWNMCKYRNMMYMMCVWAFVSCVCLSTCVCVCMMWGGA